MTTKQKKRNLSKAKLEEWHLTEQVMHQIRKDNPGRNPIPLFIEQVRSNPALADACAERVGRDILETGAVEEMEDGG
jgi:hypothetical protein